MIHHGSKHPACIQRHVYRCMWSIAQLVKLVARAQMSFEKYEAAQATLLGDALVSEEMQQVQ